MKPKKIVKRLQLNKKTVVDLSQREMRYFLGGYKDDPQPVSDLLLGTCPGLTCNTWCGTQGGTPDSDPCCNTC